MASSYVSCPTIPSWMVLETHGGVTDISNLSTDSELTLKLQALKFASLPHYLKNHPIPLPTTQQTQTSKPTSLSYSTCRPTTDAATVARRNGRLSLRTPLTSFGRSPLSTLRSLVDRSFRLEETRERGSDHTLTTSHYSHCDTCKQLGGGAYSLNQIIPQNDLHITKGNTKQYTYHGDSGTSILLLFLPFPLFRLPLVILPFPPLSKDQPLTKIMSLEQARPSIATTAPTAPRTSTTTRPSWATRSSSAPCC